MMEWFIVSIAAIVLAALLLYGYASNYKLKKEYYTVPGVYEDNCPAVKIVMLADLHGAVFGKENSRLIETIQEEEPDMICVAGDMTVKDGRGTDSCLALCRKLLSVCPIYYAVGNHEIRMECYESFLAELQKLGVRVLDNEHTCCVLRGRKLAVYGLNMEEYFYHKFWEKRELTEGQLRNDLGEPEPASYRILLAHNPEYFETYHKWGAHLVLSGHVHGGIARLPFIGGVIEPSLRLFPKYDAGCFTKGDTRMILSRGLGTHHIRLRFFNVPEVSVICIK